jgi:hypothetical protein
VEKVAIVVILWVFGGLLFVLSTGAVPQTWLGWVLLLVVGPPLFFVFEVLGEALFGSRGALPGLRTLDARVEAATAGKSFSWIRVGYGLFAALVLIAAAIVAVWVIDRSLGSRLEPVKDFLRSNFDTI